MKEVSPSWTQGALQTLMTLYTPLCIENPQIQTDLWTEFQPPNISKNQVFQALTHRAKMVCSTLELLAKEMDFLDKVLHRNSYPNWFLKKTKPQASYRPSHQPRNHQRTLCHSPFHQGLSEKFRRIFKDTKVQIIFKGCNTLKTF